MIVVGTAMTAFAIHDVFNFFFFYVIPWIVTYVYAAMANWSDHMNCEFSSVYTTSINDLNLDSRKWSFNIGYHTAHHWYPSLHWSLLQEFHDTYVAPHVPRSYYTPIWFSSFRRRKGTSHRPRTLLQKLKVFQDLPSDSQRIHSSKQSIQ